MAKFWMSIVRQSDEPLSSAQAFEVRYGTPEGSGGCFFCGKIAAGQLGVAKAAGAEEKLQEIRAALGFPSIVEK